MIMRNIELLYRSLLRNLSKAKVGKLLIPDSISTVNPPDNAVFGISAPGGDVALYRGA